MFATLASAIIFSAAVTRAQTTDPTADLQAIYKGRIPFIVQTYPVNPTPSTPDTQTTLAGWLNNLTATGQWPDVDYTTGCPARRANWPAQNHWLHVLPLAAAYTDNLPHTTGLTQTPPYDFIANATVKSALDSAMNYWFNNDFSEPACLDQGGLTNNTCPCGTPGLWNSNWYSNVILIPRQAGQACILLNSTITPEQRAKCVSMGLRGYGEFGKFIYGLGYLTGANTLDVSSNAVNVGILEAYGGNQTEGLALIDEAYGRVHNEVVIQPGVKADGIRPDGSFGQHLGILYNGNYGKDYANLVLSLEIPAAGTRWSANQTTRTAFETHIDGSQWMIYRNTKTGVEHWDFSTEGRFITFPVADLQATAGLNINLTQVQQLGQLWNSQPMQTAATNLMKNGSTANAGDLVGNRMFWDNDYMVQRGKNYVTTVKMISTRTSNTECINNQNPFAFHFAQGNVYNYVVGNEYEDIQASWDWNLLPGITTDYAATPLLCNFTQWSGNETFVGGASDGHVGVAAMDYLNPYTGAFAYKKVWFFFEDDVQHVTVSDIQKKVDAAIGGGNQDVYSVLDQKRHEGPIYVDGKSISGAGGNYTNPKSLWHGGIGYTFDTPSKPLFGAAAPSGIKQLSVNVATKTGNWSTIGTSTQPPTTVELFSAFLQHDPSQLSTPISYSVYPGTSSSKSFLSKATSNTISTVQNDGNASAAYDPKNAVLAAVFWQATTVQASYGGTTYSVGTDKPAIVILCMKTWQITVSDPTQTVWQG
ncbi:hypothetical protein FRB99_009005 [Tulasnella sp. 403]|nr:hypothetical protein FRB99_009005 [Tulasnella sp. 403]